jgi:putative membrane protein
MVQKLIVGAIAATAGLWVATQFVPDVSFSGSLQELAIAGILLGIGNTIIKPILNIITLPLRILTLGLSSFIISMGLVWATDVFFPELVIIGIVPLFWTTLVVWGVNMLLYPLKSNS